MTDIEEMSRDIDEIKEVLECGADAETKCKMISNVVNGKPHYFKEPKMGHWISTIDGKPICSECGFVSESEDGYFVSHYCPNCGAKMESEG